MTESNPQRRAGRAGRLGRRAPASRFTGTPIQQLWWGEIAVSAMDEDGEECLPDLIRRCHESPNVPSENVPTVEELTAYAREYRHTKASDPELVRLLCTPINTRQRQAARRDPS